MAGHRSRFVTGSLKREDGSYLPLILQEGRRHAYEGLSFLDTVRTVDVLAALGVGQIIFTNAAGAINPDYRVGDVVAARDIHCWPFQGFDLPASILPAFVVPGAPHQGKLAFMHGPSYETRAEIHALHALGVDTVGMSTAPELLRCHELGLPAAVLSVVTNQCNAPASLSHGDVVHTAAAASGSICEILRAYFDSPNTWALNR